MVNAGATRFRGRWVALLAGRSVSAMLTNDNGDVRAFVVATLGWLKYAVPEATRGEDALRAIRRGSISTLVVTDRPDWSFQRPGVLAR
jgi:hypothetical protein